MVEGCDTSDYTIEYRVLAAAWWHETDRTRYSMMMLRNRLRDRFNLESPEGRVIKNWEEKLFETGMVSDRRRSGRPNERGDNIDDVQAAIEDNPKTSTRRLGDELNIPRTTVRRILKKDLLKAWKPTFVQYLTEEDHQNRVECCTAILQKYSSSQMRKRLFFSDECAIYAASEKKNAVIWSNDNPHFGEQLQQHVMIWAAMSEEYLIGPYFIEGRMDTESYLQMLKGEFMPDLENRGIYEIAHLQQDGAPPHTSRASREFLNTHFKDRWVGKFGPVPWPARSPDLTSCDNALWGMMKRKVNHAKPKTKDDIKVAVRQAFEEIDGDKGLLQRIHNRTFRRLSLCINIQGLQVDPFDI